MINVVIIVEEDTTISLGLMGKYSNEMVSLTIPKLNFAKCVPKKIENKNERRNNKPIYEKIINKSCFCFIPNANNF